MFARLHVARFPISKLRRITLHIRSTESGELGNVLVQRHLSNTAVRLYDDAVQRLNTEEKCVGFYFVHICTRIFDALICKSLLM